MSIWREILLYSAEIQQRNGGLAWRKNAFDLIGFVGHNLEKLWLSFEYLISLKFYEKL